MKYEDYIGALGSYANIFGGTSATTSNAMFNVATTINWQQSLVGTTTKPAREAASPKGAVRATRDESPLKWLDRRVNELRVAL